MRNSLVSIFAVAILFGGFVIYPRSNEFTSGMIGTRFLDLSTTGRAEIMKAEIDLWKSQPILGVGPGRSSYLLKEELGKTFSAHTEYTRILAEHGILGIIAILILFAMGFKAFDRSFTSFSRVWVAALLIWSTVEMTHAAMRLAAIGFIFGLAFAKVNEINLVIPKIPVKVTLGSGSSNLS